MIAKAGNSMNIVIPAQAGIHVLINLDLRFRGDDGIYEGRAG